MTTPARSAAGPWLAAFAVAVVLGHHVGSIVGPAGEVGGRTEWADWADTVVPYAVVGTALGALRAVGVGRTAWVVAFVGAVAYVQGHGIHLSANSIGNALGDARPVHLWDEVVGHYVWYAGLYVLMAVLAHAVLGERLSGGWRWPLAVLFGLALATNGIEGGTPWMTLLAAAAFLVWGLLRRAGSGLVLAAATGVTTVAMVGWGLYWSDFRQFSELGWI